MEIKLLHKFEMIVIWIVISIGLYQCSRHDSIEPELTKIDQEAWENEKQEEGYTEEKTEDGMQEQVKEHGIIRVLIKTSNFVGIYHEELVFSSENGMYIEQDNRIISLAPNEKFMITAKELLDKKFMLKAYQNGRIRLCNVTRSEEVAYRGSMECYGTKDGIVLVNELPVEEYLYGVVPSEMPSSYPIEALKAQAISARTYTYFHMSSFAYPEWNAHVDDSTSFQVYQNISEKDNVNEAVNATKNQVIWYQGKLIESFYYSTSSGRSSGYEVWKPQEEKGWLQGKALTDFAYDRQDDDGFVQKQENKYRAYIMQGDVNDIEVQEVWYRWEYTRNFEDIKEFLNKIEAMAEKYPDEVSIRSKYKKKDKLTQESEITSCRIMQRASSGMAQQLSIQTKHFEIMIHTQQCIREALARSGDTLKRNDTSEYTLGELLPSAYFYFDTLYEDNCLKSMTIYGGGFGHGAGMSQNGAKCLAGLGMTAEDILKYYYSDVLIEEMTNSQ